MKIAAVLALVISTVAAFAPNGSVSRPATELAAERREFMSSAAAALGVAGLAAFAPEAKAIRDYEAVGYLGGGNVVDVNNAMSEFTLRCPVFTPTLQEKLPRTDHTSRLL